MLKWIARNKYKLMALIIIGYVLIDVVQHKGLTRVMLPKKFPDHKVDSSVPKNNNILINTGKEWVKAVNTVALMEKLDAGTDGIECDLYYNKTGNFFDVRHDRSTPLALNFDSLLHIYTKQQLHASIWIDLKNLRDSNYKEAVVELVRLRNKYGLAGKMLVESNRTNLLRSFSDSGFFTSFNTAPFNPYLAGNDSLKQWLDHISTTLSSSSVNAVSGYYFQYPLLKHYFPQYKILIWSPNDKFSLVNWIFKKRILADKAVFISLYP